MSHRMTCLLGGVLSLLAGPASAGQDAGSEVAAVAGRPLVLELGEFAFVTRGQSAYLEEAVAEAGEVGASALVLRIDCRGGLASAVRRFVEKAAALEIPVVAWVEGDSTGAGALAALAADRVYFADGVVLGGEVEAVEWRGPREALPMRLGDLRYAEIAEELLVVLKSKGHPEALVRGLCDPAVEVVLEGKKLSDAGDVLLLDAKAARAVGLSDGVVADLPALLAAAGIGGEPVERPAPDVVILRPVRKASGRPAGTGQAAEAPADIAAGAAVDGPGDRPGDDAEPAAGEDDAPSFGETRMESYAGKIVVIKVGDETLIRKTKFEFMQRIIEKAEADGAEAIIFDMDTPGGLLFGTIKQMLIHLQHLKTPTYTFVNPWAISAGSMIAISTDHIYMQSPGTIGASAVVTSGGGDIDGAMYEKVISTFLSAAKSVARIKGRDYDLIRAFIEVDAEYRASIPRVTEEGALEELAVLEIGDDELLALSSFDAVQIVDGQPLFADGLASSLDDLIAKAGLEGEVVFAEPLGFEAVADWIVKLAPMLLLFGIAGAYMELKMPGFGVPGFISILCFALFFFGHKTAGYLVGYEAVGLFLLGGVLVILEFFVFPGLLVFGISGFLLIFGTLIYAMVDPLNRNASGGIDLSGLGTALVGPASNLVMALVGAGLLILLALRYLPSTPMMRWMILDTGTGHGTGLQIPTAGEEGAPGEGEAGLIGRTGVAETDLRPAGAARFGGERIDVVSTGDFIENGAAVRIVEHEGARIAVEQV